MERDEKEEKAIYKVVVDPSGQYSIWPADRENALGWNDAGKTGTRQQCMDYIKEASADKKSRDTGKEIEETGGMRGDL